MRCHHACRSQICSGQPFPVWCWRVVCSPCPRALRRRMLFHLSNFFHLHNLIASVDAIEPSPADPCAAPAAFLGHADRVATAWSGPRWLSSEGARYIPSLRFAGWRTGQLEVSSHRARGASPAHRSLARSLSFCVFGLRDDDGKHASSSSQSYFSFSYFLSSHSVNLQTSFSLVRLPIPPSPLSARVSSTVQWNFMARNVCSTIVLLTG
ncbi:hypothetical protein HDK77DRAFT_321963 [Phyllosticta capitalensis]